MNCKDKLSEAIKLLLYAKEAISQEDHVKMGLVLVRIRDSEVQEISNIWTQSTT